MSQEAFNGTCFKLRSFIWWKSKGRASSGTLECPGFEGQLKIHLSRWWRKVARFVSGTKNKRNISGIAIKPRTIEQFS